jgi:class 3 adenylate cyclase
MGVTGSVYGVPADWASAGDWLEAVRDAERRGELLTAFDLAERGLEQHPGNRALQHRSVLALARVGSTGEADRRFAAYGLDSVADEDVGALGARIAKDRALAASGPQHARLAAVSAELYAAVHKRTGGYYPAINAASMSMIAGEREAARALAELVLPLSEADDYFAAATRAEAQLLLGDPDAATAELERAAHLHAGDWGAIATTRRQLTVVCKAMRIDPAVLDVLPSPAVAHFCGHRIRTTRFGAESEHEVAAKIADELRRRPVDYAYGALASGADILWAEAMLRGGAELHVVLPFASSAFVASSVSPAGAGWVERFKHCMAAASTVRYATEDALAADDVLYRYGAELAMGLAVLRARHLCTHARQLAVWDGKPVLGGAGTAIDIAKWRDRGLQSTVIEPPASHDTTTEQPAAQRAERLVRAILFADVKGFSKLADDQHPVFTTEVMGALARVVHANRSTVDQRKTWGDGLLVILHDAPTAATCALQMQRALAGLDLEAAGLPSTLALRLGAHLGPIFQMTDPVEGGPLFLGSHVSRAARIEPVTPPGTVYVTEPFAAALELAGTTNLACDYVGHMPAAKEYGRLRMYRLREQT